jgi:2-octaprenyl-6-methoxyphenol hydroxylase
MASKQTDIHTDILINGGGIAGLTLAALLAKAGMKVTVVDAGAPFKLQDVRPGGRTVALMENMLNVIRSAGAWDMVAPYANPLKSMRIMDDSAPKKEPVAVDFPANDIGMAQFGFNIPNGCLHAALWEIAQKSKNITILAPQSLKNFTAHATHISAQLESRAKITAPIIIGADGRSSIVREIAGIPVTKKAYGQSAITCLIKHSQPHHDIATEFHRPGGPLALVPLPGQTSSVVWVHKTARSESLIALKKQDFESALQDATRDALGKITLETNPECWPLISICAKKLIAPRTALMAEAAHVMSPITAQGLNLSLRDVAALAETIIDAVRIGLDIGSASVLAQYEKRRMPDIQTRVMGVDSMNKLVSQDIFWLKDLRRSGLKAVDMLPGIKRFAMRQGLAPQIDLGRLTRGEAL